VQITVRDSQKAGSEKKVTSTAFQAPLEQELVAEDSHLPLLADDNQQQDEPFAGGIGESPDEPDSQQTPRSTR
jgi:hypothetical protein